jgi:hypothetical protein
MTYWPDRDRYANEDLVDRIQGWNRVPKNLRTRRQWSKVGRTVQAHSTPEAIVEWSDTAQSHSYLSGSSTRETQDHAIRMSANLFSVEQTTKCNNRLATKASQIFEKLFVRHSNRQKYIWHTGDHWVSCGGKLSDDLVRRHIRGQDVYGIGGGKKTHFMAIDLDLHGADQDIFMDQLQALQGEFHGNGWHFQVATHDVGGVHLIKVFDKPRDLETLRYQLRNRLQALSKRHPELAERAKAQGMKTLADLEVFPNTKAGFRLPLCRGRTMLLDKPLDLVWDNRLRSEVADVIGYMSWVVSPKRKYMSAEEILDYVRFRLPKAHSKQSFRLKSAKQGKGGMTKLESMKGRFAQFLTDFWTGKDCPADSLNQAIVLLARLLPYYLDDEQQALDLIEQYIDQLPSHDFSDRLTNGNRKEVSRVIRNTVHTVYDANGGQTNVDESTQKLKATVAAWKTRGFDPTDKSTWASRSVLAQTKLAPSFSFTPQEIGRLTELKDVLKADLDTCARVTKTFIRFVKVHPGEISVSLVRQFLRECGLRAGHGEKPNKFLSSLCRWGWIYVRVRERPPFVRYDGTVEPGRARAYGLGEAMAAKFIETPDTSES